MLDSSALYKEALKLIPGGVNSPVRAGQAVGAEPKFVARGQGAYIFDVEGQKYVDFVGSWGPLILGHAYSPVVEAIAEAARLGSSFGAPTEAETKLATLIHSHLPNVPMLRLVNSGTEAAMSAIRLARGATSRDKILKFTGCYHGHADSLLVAAGSGLATFSLPSSLGTPKSLAELTITCPYNDPESLKELLAKAGDQIAAVIVELVAGNMGLVLPKPEFIEALKTLPQKYGALLIADEVITGFRVGFGGAQGLYSLKPDLTILGKIIGGGLPLAAFGGRRDLMEQLAPLGGVYQAGTLSGNPVAVAAGLATLETLTANPQIYIDLTALTEKWTTGLSSLIEAKGWPHTITRLGSMNTLFFSPDPVYDLASAQKSDTRLYGAYFRTARASGVWLPPSQFETTFLSAAFTEATVNEALARLEIGLKNFPSPPIN
ncbi:MAG: glutamate-1-semialdehyde 2,1-aminomutase [Deltaproteobacteria bacterium]|jgi:glutamate-1-semialdehyde 2,1-aminomutase|nr:glutamate-1-semialdehyde 2,1-aminomutase [Deltaproteobacteria bacterium]